MQNKLLIIVPVLNEVNNIEPLLKRIFRYVNKNKDILFINDNSTDGTHQKIIEEKKRYKRIFLLNRIKKSGIGSAHKDALKWGFKRKYKYIITMDCDGTHDPKYINKFLNLLKQNKYQIISTNRFINTNSLDDWSLWRKKLTTLRHNLIKFLLNIDYDSSGAFRAYNVKMIELKDIYLAKNDSYSFFWESMYILSKKYKIKEIPITLPGRLSGSSKMRITDIFLALFYLTKIFLTK